jgi:hypothetical protein
MESDKIMFEVYRRADYGREFAVVYFTELNEHNKEAEISRAMAGEHVYDGFINTHGSKDAKRIIADFVDRLNRGESPTPQTLETALADFIPA